MQVKKEITQKTLRQFGLLMPIPLGIIGVILLLTGKSTGATVLFAIAGGFLLLGLAIPIALKPIYVGWMAFARVLGFVNSLIILSLLFFLIIFPMAVIFKLRGKDPLDRKMKREVDTYWETKEAAWADHTRFERQF